MLQRFCFVHILIFLVLQPFATFILPFISCFIMKWGNEKKNRVSHWNVSIHWQNTRCFSCVNSWSCDAVRTNNMLTIVTPFALSSVSVCECIPFNIPQLFRTHHRRIVTCFQTIFTTPPPSPIPFLSPPDYHYYLLLQNMQIFLRRLFCSALLN